MFLIISLLLIFIILFRYRKLPFQHRLTEFCVKHFTHESFTELHHKRVQRTKRLNQYGPRRRRLMVQTVHLVIFGIAMFGSFFWIAPLLVDRMLTHNAVWIYASAGLMVLILALGPIYVGLAHYLHIKQMRNRYLKTAASKRKYKFRDLFLGTLRHPIEFSVSYFNIVVNVVMVLLSAALWFIPADEIAFTWLGIIWLADVLYAID